jgi:NAD+ synthase
LKSISPATDYLALDCAAETERIASALRAYLKSVRRRGIVLGLSGGIDSTVTAALAVRALGRERVFGLHMPERDSEAATVELSRSVAAWLGIADAIEDITDMLEAAGCYRRYEAAARRVVPAFNSTWKSKVAIHASAGDQTFSYFTFIAQPPDGPPVTTRLGLEAYLEIVAATNFKQRTRKMLEYYHADRLNYAVAGTPNRLEYDQGFFVKNGDGAADFKPIAHLYKTQVYRLAEFLGVPEEIRKRPPTTDTYSLPQGQDEFYFALPFQQMDLCLFGKNNHIPSAAIAEAAGIDRAVVERVWMDIDRKRSTTRYLHLQPALVQEVPEVSTER